MAKRKGKWINKMVLYILIALLFKVFLREEEDIFLDWDLLYIPIIVLILLEGNMEINQWLNKRYNWMDNPKRRLIRELLFSAIFTSVALFILLFVIHYLKYRDGFLFFSEMRLTFSKALLVAFAIQSFNINYQFFNSLKNSMVEVETYKIASANAQLQNLKNQLNPHFLFNNLSVLTSLVHKDQNKAVHFINELSKVFRYVLDSKNAELVKLQEELSFLEHYIYLLKIRFESSIDFCIKIDESQKNSYLPPMCLQMLVENTIQHNEASHAKPLKVFVYTLQDKLIIENQIQPRSDAAQSSKMGLKNIQSRYAYFTDEKVEIMNDGKTFEVALPLISKT